MLTLLYLSDNTLVATLTDSAGDAVTGGTGTVTIVGLGGTEVSGVSWPEDLTDESDGTYTYDVPYNILSANQRYKARVTFTAPGNRYAEIPIVCAIDVD